MLIHIDRDLHVHLEAPEDFKRFSVQIDGSKLDIDPFRVAAKVAGELQDEDTMWVSEAWLRSAPGCAGDPAWQAGVSSMIAFARKHGWVRDPSGDIRAHVTWTI